MCIIHLFKKLPLPITHAILHFCVNASNIIGTFTTVQLSQQHKLVSTSRLASEFVEEDNHGLLCLNIASGMSTLYCPKRKA